MKLEQFVSGAKRPTFFSTYGLTAAATMTGCLAIKFGSSICPDASRIQSSTTETSMNDLRPFHLAFPVRDVQEARRFYAGMLGCTEGRSAETWVDFNFFGHQIVAHYNPNSDYSGQRAHHNPVDGHDVPVPHFGIILTMDQWKMLRNRLIDAKIEFVVEPHVRFAGEIGEQATMFFLDPTGNALEFKAFNDLSQLFAKQSCESA